MVDETTGSQAGGQPPVRGTLRVSMVKEAISTIRSTPIHETFAGYLALRAAAHTQNRDQDLRPQFKQFFDDYLAVRGAPTAAPYLKLFNGNGKPTLDNVWFNANVAGSYAPSSLRAQSPLLRVVQISGGGAKARYSLASNHAAAASEHLLSKRRISGIALAIALFRDFVIEAPSAQLGDELIGAFRATFGFSDERSRKDGDYELLFAEEAVPDGRYFDVIAGNPERVL